MNALRFDVKTTLRELSHLHAARKATLAAAQELLLSGRHKDEPVAFRAKIESMMTYERLIELRRQALYCSR